MQIHFVNINVSSLEMRDVLKVLFFSEEKIKSELQFEFSIQALIYVLWRKFNHDVHIFYFQILSVSLFDICLHIIILTVSNSTIVRDGNIYIYLFYDFGSL